MIRVVLVDDHPVVRQGISRLLGATPGIEVVGEAADGAEAVEQVRRLRPDVALMDIAMPRMDGIAATRRIRSENPQVRVIGLSMHSDTAHFERMLAAGAALVLPKTTGVKQLVEAILAGHSPVGSGAESDKEGCVRDEGFV